MFNRRAIANGFNSTISLSKRILNKKRIFKVVYSFLLESLYKLDPNYSHRYFRFIHNNSFLKTTKTKIPLTLKKYIVLIAV